MRRFDLRKYKENFLDRLGEIIDSQLDDEEIAIFMFEIGDFDNVYKSAELVKQKNAKLMNSLRFNEMDWTLVVKKTKRGDDGY